MSLFDSIRYPVIDIFDDDEMSRIPRDIIDSFITDITNFVDAWSVTIPYYNGGIMYGTTAFNVVRKCAMESESYGINIDNGTKLYKGYFTQILRQKIYDAK